MSVVQPFLKDYRLQMGDDGKDGIVISVQIAAKPVWIT
jgi:hypothetical protein